MNKSVKISIKFDIGTSRLGFLPNQIEEVKKINQYKKIFIDNIYGHLASSESDPQYTNKQIKLFNKILSELLSVGVKSKINHISCSAACVLFKNARLNGARVGLGLYGLYSAKKMRTKIKLKPALSMYTKILQIKKIKKGTNIGYGGTFFASKNIDLAIMPVGYWDGYDRRLSNNSHVLINGQRCPIRGNICMNLAMAELPLGHNFKEGDKVVLIGKDKNQLITTDLLAKKCNTINYEFIDRLNPQIPRIII
jgi:alanine racemase